jgi:hypothetical protein
MDISNLKVQPKKQEDVASRKEVKEDEEGSGSSSTDSVNSGSVFFLYYRSNLSLHLRSIQSLWYALRQIYLKSSSTNEKLFFCYGSRGFFRVPGS